MKRGENDYSEGMRAIPPHFFRVQRNRRKHIFACHGLLDLSGFIEIHGRLNHSEAQLSLAYNGRPSSKPHERHGCCGSIELHRRIAHPTGRMHQGRDGLIIHCFQGFGGTPI